MKRSKLIEAAGAVIAAMNAMSDAELIDALDGADTTMAYAINPEAFIPDDSDLCDGLIDHDIPLQTVPPVPECDHDLEFLGPSVGKTDLYMCTKCKEQISKRYYEWQK